MRALMRSHADFFLEPRALPLREIRRAERGKHATPIAARAQAQPPLPLSPRRAHIRAAATRAARCVILHAPHGQQTTQHGMEPRGQCDMHGLPQMIRPAEDKIMAQHLVHPADQRRRIALRRQGKRRVKPPIPRMVETQRLAEHLTAARRLERLHDACLQHALLQGDIHRPQIAQIPPRMRLAQLRQRRRAAHGLRIDGRLQREPAKVRKRIDEQ